MKSTLRPFAALLVALPLAACGDDGGSTPDATDTGGADTVADTGGADTSDEDTVANDYGFAIRYPATHTIPCASPSPELPIDDLEQPDADWLCTFAYGGASGMVYLRATPTGCVVSLTGNPVFDQCAGWIALDGTVSPLADAGYDWGGNHHNDTITFTWDGKRFTFDHSSLGWGWRACQEPDCLVVHDATGALVEDGCTMERTLPAVCRLIGTDGTWGSFEDTFAVCDGDPNYE
ncbi:MAG: hypothetical protein EP329_05655 [Deltaproteobacteria bacterium]|nr:MAG: hypothetical protein EP329_05655 [Deltaproteobacteria bacterium]